VSLVPGAIRHRINVNIQAAYRRQVSPLVLRAAARAVLSHQVVPVRGELTIVIAGDARLRNLNRQYLGHDRPTDVLSFPSGETDPAGGLLYLGDIAISFPRARQQAGREGHSVKAELQLLVVHGVLHLLGYDHVQPAEKDRMWAAQAAILGMLKSAISGPGNNPNAGH
jgi:probable rRNA maturation factor